MLYTDYGGVPLDESELLDIQSAIDPVMSTAQNLAELAIRFFLNLLVCWAIVRFFYFRKSRRRDYFFTFICFSSAMLLLLYMMGNVEVGVGLTLGMFAIFGVIRYRTETVPIREMTYLFVIIAIAAVNGLAPLYRLSGTLDGNPHYLLSYGDIAITVLTNLLAVGLIWILESSSTLKHSATKIILYDRIELIVPERREELFADIEKRCGIKADRIEIGNIDFLKDSAFIKVYYTPDSEELSTISSITRYKQFTEQQELS